MICIIGTRWGRVLGRELRSFYHGPLAVCGLDPARLKKVADELRAGETMTDWRRAAYHPAVTHVILAVPPHRNREIATRLLQAGKHVLVEKPLACTLEDCDAILDAARTGNAVLAVGENIPFRPALVEAKKRLAEIGKPRLLVATAICQMPCKQPGILLDFAVHPIRAVRYLLGEPDSVFASQARNLTGNCDDNATLVLASRAAGWQAVITLSWQAGAGVNPEFILTGTAGAMKIWPASTSLDLYPVAPNRITRAIARVRPNALREMLASPETQRRRIHLPREDRMGYRAELRDFLARTNLPLPNLESALQARRDLAVVMLAYQSLEEARRAVA